MTTDTPTLAEMLAARHALAIFEGAGGADFTPSDAELALTLPQLANMSAVKLDMLRATLTKSDIHATSLRMTAAVAQRIIRSAARKAKPPLATSGSGLTAADLDDMTFGSWAECAHWLAGLAGFTVEERPILSRDTLLAFRGRVNEKQGGAVVICALRLPPGAALLGDDVRHLATIASNEPGARLVAVTTAEVTAGAALIAREVNADLYDRDALNQLLATQATAFARERAQSQSDAKAQAKAAAAARKKLLTALTAADTQAKAPLPAQRASGRVAVRKAMEQAREARRIAGQALIAWETLVAEWTGTFGERPARDGTLPMLGQPAVWADLGARADHLKKPLIDALRALAKTPGDGDLGYGAWRLALSEELAARCSALLWRVNLVDPAQWEDFSAAVNDAAVREASRADNAATHAAARAERAQSLMTERAGVA